MAKIIKRIDPSCLTKNEIWLGYTRSSYHGAYRAAASPDRHPAVRELARRALLK